MAFEIITLNLIPDGEMPVFHASQFDTARPVIIDLVMGEDAYVVPEGITLELHCRKVDDTIVTMEPDEVSENRVTFVTTEQLTACIGDNLCEVALLNGDDHIGTLNFIMHVEPDPLAGGLTSETDIYNLTQQIEDIATEVIGEDYYDKTEVDALLADKADVSDLPDMSNYYNKTETDNLLYYKADVSVLNANYYTKWGTDALLADKADKSELPDMDDYYDKSYIDTRFSIYRSWDSTQIYLANNYYNKSQVDALIDNIFPTLTASGTIATFRTALSKPLVSVTTEEGATTVTRCGLNLTDISDGNGNIMRGVTPSYDNDGGLTFTGTVSENGWCGSWNVDFTLPAGTYTFSISNPEIDHNITFALDWSAKVVIDRNTASKTVTFSAPQRINRITLNSNSDDVGNNIDINIKHILIEVGSSASTYEEYISETVPVADATTLETLPGTNNVFADSGDVTVQYKYMSI